ncbi:MAG TPA: DUF488 domain-containing protein [Limnochordales bacterium]
MQNFPGTAVYTIGYGQRRGPEVIDLLRRHGIQYLVDVRTAPYSRFRPEFSRQALEQALPPAGLRYVFMGDLLGGRPSDPSCYRDGKVDYTVLSRTPAYQQGIKRLKNAWVQGLRVCLLCSEERPEECHRSKLIGQSLVEHGIPVRHIDADGSVVDHEAVMRRLTGGQQCLFGMVLTSRKRYRVRESRLE